MKATGDVAVCDLTESRCSIVAVAVAAAAAAAAAAGGGA